VLLEKELAPYSQLTLSRTNKGALVAVWEGQKSDAPRALTAHIDTLGGMVKEIKSSGRLAITRIGGLLLPAVENEGCWVHTAKGKKIRGSFLANSASAHVYGKKAFEDKRDEAGMEIRLDALTQSDEDTRKLGIQVGDYISFDPRVEVTEGFIRSHFLDDKACVAAVLAAIKAIATSEGAPVQRTYFHFSNYEEVGHGASAGIPGEVAELVAVDMAAVGEGQTSDEFHATICVKDSGGPYHHGLSQKLRALADRYKIPYKVDIYPYYGSDGEAFLARGRGRGRSVDRSRGRRFTQLRAYTYTGPACDNQLASGLLADGMTSKSCRYKLICRPDRTY